MHSLEQRIDWKSMKQLQLTTNILFYFVLGGHFLLFFSRTVTSVCFVWLLAFLACNLSNILLDLQMSFFWTWNIHVVLMRGMFIQFLIFWEIQGNLWEMPLHVTLCHFFFLCFFTAKWPCLVCTRPQFGKMSQIVFFCCYVIPSVFVSF